MSKPVELVRSLSRLANPKAAHRPLLQARVPRPTYKSSFRQASTTASPIVESGGIVSRARILLLSFSAGASIYFLYLYATDTRASVHQWLVPRLTRVLFPDAEDSHNAGVASLKTLYSLGLHPRERSNPTSSSHSSSSPSAINPPADLATTIFNGTTTLSNPIAISAGLDKHAEIPDALFDLGAAVVEVGGITPQPQQGNPKPRVWRVPNLQGMVNRYGLNSRGADAVAASLRTRLRNYAAAQGLSEAQVLAGGGGSGEGIPVGSLQSGKLLLVQIAKNKDTDEKDVDAVARDYVYCVNRLAPYADVIVVNVSSPNTPGLRDLQAAEPLAKILSAVVHEAKVTPGRRLKPKVMVKVSPDEDEQSQMEGIVEAVFSSGVDGVIVGNTTKRRDRLQAEGVQLTNAERKALQETGGYSGPALFDKTVDLISRYRKLLDSSSHKASDGKGTTSRESAQKAVFATGGINNGQQAAQVLNAGADVAMVYTGLIYGGLGTITRIKDELRLQGATPPSSPSS